MEERRPFLKHAPMLVALAIVSQTQNGVFSPSSMLEEETVRSSHGCYGQDVQTCFQDCRNNRDDGHVFHPEQRNVFQSVEFRNMFFLHLNVGARTRLTETREMYSRRISETCDNTSLSATNEFPPLGVLATKPKILVTLSATET